MSQEIWLKSIDHDSSRQIDETNPNNNSGSIANGILT